MNHQHGWAFANPPVVHLPVVDIDEVPRYSVWHLIPSRRIGSGSAAFLMLSEQDAEALELVIEVVLAERLPQSCGVDGNNRRAELALRLGGEA